MNHLPPLPVRLLCLWFLLLALFITVFPIVQQRFSLFKEETLEGFVVSVSYPEFSLSTWFSGKFQSSFETWWNEHLGFRGALIKTVNQVYFSLFNEVGGGSRTKIVLGKDNFLYEKGYIDNYHNRDSVPVEVLKKKVENIKQLQDALEEKGIPFLLIISPSKATIYPEYIPSPWNIRRAGILPTKYELIRPLLDEAGIHWIDAPQFFLEKKSEYAFPLFARGGTHWNYYGACLVVEKITLDLEHRIEKPMVRPVCDPAGGDLTPINTERDLVSLLNIWDKSFPNESVPHPPLTSEIKPSVYRPNVVWIGDSFVWTLVDIAYGGHQFATQDIYYYWQERHELPTQKTERINPNTLNWEKEIWNKDIIIVETNETAVDIIGFGFVEAALKQLDAH